MWRVEFYDDFERRWYSFPATRDFLGAVKRGSGLPYSARVVKVR